MEKWKQKKLKAKIADFFELPSEVVLDLPRLVLTGRQRLFMENHRGIKEYTPTIIRINTTVSQLIVRGRELELIVISQEKIEIVGQIQQVEWGKRGETD